MVTISKVTAKLIVSLAAIAAGGIIIYKCLYDYFIGPRKAIEDTLKKLVETKTRFYTETIMAQGGALTAEQEKYLEDVNKRIDEYGAKVMAWGGDFSAFLQGVLIVAATGVFLIIAFKYGVPAISKAAKYLRANVTNVKTSAGMEALMRCSVNVALAEAGQTSLATAAQTSTEMWVRATLNPVMQSEIALLTAQMPTLVGTQLLWAQFMVASLQFQMVTAVPATLAAAWAVMTPLL